MEQIGMRELRHRLREYIARVQAGERFEVTSFGRPVAQLLPSDGRPVGLAQLIAEGRVTPALDPDTTALPTPVPSTTGISAAGTLLAERDADPR
jgi:prevent-host-death family protein